ncbi:MAG: hypothetical protein M1834_004761 [Cirrosporium novae-zelandiae]|nr:MAG: hypothetical protein M1834_004761 [Cirrosporium novae-zelandiae]
MEHLQQVSEKARSSFQIPFICSREIEDLGGSGESGKASFIEFPARHGFDLEALKRGELAGRGLGLKVAAFLQGWLFFGLLRAVFTTVRVPFNVEDFLKKGAMTERPWLISTAKLSLYIRYWQARQVHNDPADDQEQEEDINSIIELANMVVNALIDKNLLSSSHLSNSAENHANLLSEGPSLGELVLLSIVILSEAVGGVRTEDIYLRSKRAAALALQWRAPPIVRQWLIKAKWCIGEIERIEKEADVTSRVFLASMGRSGLGKDHSKCTGLSDYGCRADDIDESSYQTKHTDDCLGCEQLLVPDSAADIVLQSGILLIKMVIESGSNGKLVVEASETASGNLKRYVAISHVWSDGMGNPHQNSLPRCQLWRVQALVNALYDEMDDPVPFWIDTMCVPLERNARKKAILRMADTYIQADKVLVLDSSLQQCSRHISNSETLVRIRYSPWVSRLWTLQEGILAAEVYIQMKEAAISIDSLLPFTGGSFKELSTYLAPQKELSSCDKLLVRALAYRDPESFKSRQLYANLPPQEDPDMEEIRQDAQKLNKSLAHIDTLHAVWEPIAQSFHDSGYPSECDGMLHSRLGEQLWNSLVTLETEIFHEIRGDYFNRSSSSDNYHQSGQRAALSQFHTPARILEVVARALPRRTTSHIEDETICISSLIGLNVSPLFETADLEARMKKFWQGLGEIPSNIIFYRLPRMPYDGWRWAPRTFLRQPQKIPRMAPGAQLGKVSENGLTVVLNGLLLEHNLQPINVATGGRVDDSLLAVFASYENDMPEYWGSLHLFSPSSSSSSSSQPPQRISWYNYFPSDSNNSPSRSKRQLAILLENSETMSPILVSISKIGERNNGIIHARFEANVEDCLRRNTIRGRIREKLKPPRDALRINCRKLRVREWCIG